MKILIIILSVIIFSIGMAVANIPLYTVPNFWHLPITTVICLVIQMLLTCVISGFITGRLLAKFL